MLFLDLWQYVGGFGGSCLGARSLGASHTFLIIHPLRFIEHKYSILTRLLGIRANLHS